MSSKPKSVFVIAAELQAAIDALPPDQKAECDSLIHTILKLRENVQLAPAMLAVAAVGNFLRVLHAMETLKTKANPKN